MRQVRILAVSAVVALALVACTGDDPEPTTTTLGGGTTTPTQAESTTTSAPEATDTTLRGQVVTDYETVARLSTSNGEVLHIVIPQGGYTDIDLYGFIADLKDADPDLWGIEVFDSAEAAAAYAVAEGERTDEQAQMITRHHLISLVSGDTIRYQGPFREFGEEILGS